ncbi:MAG: hypothetical protein ABIU05_09135, partial [Nitrospirales bacterium]
RVVDANNNVVGQVIGTNNEHSPISSKALFAVVALNISVPSIVVKVTSTGFLGTAYLYFTDSTCVGQPYFKLQELNFPLRLFPVVGAGRNGAALYAPRASSASVVILNTYLLNFLGECDSGGGPLMLSPLIQSLT